MARIKPHPLRAWMERQKPPQSYRDAEAALGCHFTGVQKICTWQRWPRRTLAKKIIAWTKGAVTMEHLYGGK